jgi:septum formation protein
LQAAGFEVVIRPSDVDELSEGLAARDLVTVNAERKALHVADTLRGDLVLGADTVVVLEGEILGKPRDHDHAFEMLCRLSGRIHEVLTGVCLVRGGSRKLCLFVESTRVAFRTLDGAMIRSYLAEIDPLDKAGSYAAQDDRGRLIEQIEGSAMALCSLTDEPLSSFLSSIDEVSESSGGDLLDSLDGMVEQRKSQLR